MLKHYDPYKSRKAYFGFSFTFQIGIKYMSRKYFNSYYSNKDHQRIMLDPMIMIVQNLGLFLTAVTPTTVAPTANHFGPYWTI